MEKWREDLYLQHYGVLGMKWGVRRYQPYSVNPRKSGKKGKFIGDKNAQTYDPLAVLLPLTPLAVSLTANAAIALISKGRAYAKEKAALKRMSEITEIKNGLPVKQKKTTIKQDIQQTNPGYSPFRKGVTNNCVACSVAFDLRRRGYDVAAGKLNRGLRSYEIQKIYKNTDLNRIKPDTSKKVHDIKFRNPATYKLSKEYVECKKTIAEATKRTFDQMPNGSRGMINVLWSNSIGIGHSMVFMKENDELKIICTQTRKEENLDKLLKRVDGVDFMLLNNATPDYNFIKERGLIEDGHQKTK